MVSPPSLGASCNVGLAFFSDSVMIAAAAVTRSLPMPVLALRSVARCLALAAGLGASAASAEPVSRDRVEAALPQLRAMAEQVIAAGGAPGLAVAVVHEDEAVFLEGFGLRRIGQPETVDADTVFQLASLSKPVSATVVAALVGDGKLDWDTRIRDLDPAFALHDAYPSAEVTVRDLFNHRSGLPGTSGDDLEAIGYERDAIIERLRLVPPSSSFRGGYAYSNAGLTAGAVAAARATGMEWETVAEERLFAPLGMKSASYRHDDFERRGDAAALHVRVDGVWSAAVTRDADAQAPAGGVSASAGDLVAWLRLELAGGAFDGRPLVDAAALAANHEPLTSRGPNRVTGGASFYGLGWAIEFGRHGLSWLHAGAFSTGARTLAVLYPDADLGIVVLANAFPTGAPEAIADSFADLVFDGTIAMDYATAWNGAYEGLFGPAIAAAAETYAARPEPATPPMPPAAYFGAYGNAYVGAARIEPDGDGLAFVVGPDGARRYPLTHFDRDLFLYYPDPEMPATPAALRFAIGPDGRALSLTAESLDSNGLGTLTRAAD